MSSLLHQTGEVTVVETAGRIQGEVEEITLELCVVYMLLYCYYVSTYHLVTCRKRPQMLTYLLICPLLYLVLIGPVY